MSPLAAPTGDERVRTVEGKHYPMKDRRVSTGPSRRATGM